MKDHPKTAIKNSEKNNLFSDWTKGLNPEQAKAVLHTDGPLLILAGAGSGKTTVLVARTGRMIAEGKAKGHLNIAKEICVLTFTNKAARELKHRVSQRLGPAAKGLWAGTFHSFGLDILRSHYKEAHLPHHFGVIDQSDCQSILKELVKEVRVVGKEKFDLEKVLEIINEKRVRKSSGLPDRIEAFDEYHEVAEVLYPKFIKRLDLLGVVDFDGLLLKPLELFQTHPEVLKKYQDKIRYMMVDEFQDTNDIQMKLIDKIVHQHRNIAVVGDDDQSIYGWRGAQVANILDFPKIYPPCEVIRLERNYRSKSSILTVANEVISKNRHRHGKVLKAEGYSDHGEPPELFLLETEDDEAEFVYREIEHFKQQGYHPKDMAVLYRSNSQGGMIESVFRTYHIPYTVSGGTGFFDRKEVKDILAYLRCALAMNDVSLRRVINTPSRGIGDTTLEKISDYAKSKKISFHFACQAALKDYQYSEMDFSNSYSKSQSQPQSEHQAQSQSPLKIPVEQIPFQELKENKTNDLSEMRADVHSEIGSQANKNQVQGSFFKEPEMDIPTASKAAIKKFLDLLKDMPTQILSPIGSQTAGEALVQWMQDIGYRDYVFSLVSEPSSGEKKWMLVEILGRILDGFVKRGGLTEKTLKDFLDAMELRDDPDDDENQDKVSLMTLHACKGLEFPVVIIVGIEEDLLPHKTLGSDIDEERRLFYVGVTRAKERLVMTRCKTRRRHGVVRPVSPSRFLLEISNQHVKDYKSEFRPVSSDQRQSMLDGFLAKLDSKIQSNK